MFKNSTAAILVSLALAAPARADFDLSWSTIDGGRALFSSGAGYSLGGTIGQPDAGTLTGGAFTLAGGFWSGASVNSPCPGNRGDANCDGSIGFFDIDPFLTALFDASGYAAAFCGGSICAADTDSSASVDFFDIDPFQLCLFGGCTPCP